MTVEVQVEKEKENNRKWGKRENPDQKKRRRQRRRTKEGGGERTAIQITPSRDKANPTATDARKCWHSRTHYHADTLYASSAQEFGDGRRVKRRAALPARDKWGPYGTQTLKRETKRGKRN